MSGKESGISPEAAIQMAIERVRSKGMSDEHFDALFAGTNEITTREALLVAQIQHLEARVFALTSVMEEMAAMKHEPESSLIAQTALENLSYPRMIKGS